MAGGNGSPLKGSEGEPVKVIVVDRRHHALAKEGEEAGAAPAEGPRYPSFVEELRAQTEAARLKAHEAIARAEQEVDAVRERLTRDVERRVLAGRARLLTAVLDIADNLDRAATAAASESKTIADGIRLISQQVQAILKFEGVEPIETVGQPYDPHVAEAVAIEQGDPSRDGVVLEEFQRGYRLGETVLRPAKVKVGKG